MLPTVNPAHILKQVDNETILFDIDNNSSTHLDIIASHIWHNCKNGNTKLDLLDHLLSEYDVDRETLLNDIDNILYDMTLKGVLLPDRDAILVPYICWHYKEGWLAYFPTERIIIYGNEFLKKELEGFRLYFLHEKRDNKNPDEAIRNFLKRIGIINRAFVKEEHLDMFASNPKRVVLLPTTDCNLGLPT